MPFIERDKKFEEFLVDRNHMPFNGIASALNNRQIPFRNNLFFIYNPAYLASQEWNRCVELYLDKTPNYDVAHLYNLIPAIQEDEREHKQHLENLAEKIIREMYNIPDDITIYAEISTSSEDDLNNSEEEDDDDEPEIEEVDLNKIEPHIQKRILLNSLIHGVAVHQWISSFYIGYDELNNLNPNLIEHYNSYASLISYYNWQHPMALLPEALFNLMFGLNNGKERNNANNNPFNFPQEQPEAQQDNPALIQGHNKNNIKNKTIHATGINFPVLLHELSKGAMEFLFIRGIPEDLSKSELITLYEKADKYSHEFWHYYMGPTIWRALIDASELTTQELPEFLSKISILDYNDLSSLLSYVTYDVDEKGKQILNQIKNQTK